MVWISVLLQNSYIEILMSIVMVLGGGALEKRLGHESETLVNQVSVLLNETPQSLLVPSTVWKGRSGKIALYKPRNLHQTPNLQMLSSWTSQLPELWEINVIYKPPVCGIFVVAAWMDQDTPFSYLCI